MKLSVIITAFNQHNLTVAHVRECMKSTLLPDEIIVVNDHGNPDLKEKLEKLDKKTKLIYAYIEDDINWNYTGARNLGVWISTGDYIVSEDNDNIPARTLYQDMFAHLTKNPECGMVLAGKRPKVLLDDVLNNPMEQWKTDGFAPGHDDSYMMLRSTYIRMKGYDERFAGQYGWACTDWKRRLNRAEINVNRISTHYFIVPDGETTVCECGKTKEQRASSVVCPDCKIPYKKLSYRNYSLARKNTYVQPPGSILNFNYSITEL